MTRRLEIGPGEKRLEGSWITLDVVERPGVVDHVCRWGTEPLPFADDSFDLVYASHVLEHVPWHQTLSALRETRRVLAPEGVLEVHVPDFQVLATAAQYECCPDCFGEEGFDDELHWMHCVAKGLFHFGPEAQWHKACFNASHLTWCLQQAGFVEIERVEMERGPSHGVVNLGMSGTKPADNAAPTKAVPPSSTGSPELFMLSADYSEEPQAVPGAEELQICHSRREYDAATKTFFCAHPNVHTSQNLVNVPICRSCERWKEPPPEEFRIHSHAAVNGRGGPCWYLGNHTGLRLCTSCRGKVKTKVYACLHTSHESTTIDDCMRCPDYDPRLEPRTIRRWAIGITTAPRKLPTLRRTLTSLAAAGWEAPFIFAEPGSNVGGIGDEAHVVSRAELLGEWPNWILGLMELYQRQPTADAYLMAEDDVLFCRNLRSYLETVLWPAETLGVVSLYNPSQSEPAKRGFEVFDSAGLPGALALVFPNAAARLLLSDSRVLLHRRRGPSIGSRLTDVVVGEWAQRSGWPAYLHWPSLCQHIGDTTSVWQAEQDFTVRAAVSYVGEDFDAQTLVRKAVLVR